MNERKRSNQITGAFYTLGGSYFGLIRNFAIQRFIDWQMKPSFSLKFYHLCFVYMEIHIYTNVRQSSVH